MNSVATVQPSFVSSSRNRVTTAANTVTAPTSIQNGDLLVAVGLTSSPVTGITPPTGFNVFQFDNDGTNNTFFLASKRAFNESGDYTFTWSAAFANTIAILVYRNATAVNTVGSLARASSGTTGTASTITPTYTGVLIAAFMKEAIASVTTAPSDMTERVQFGNEIVSMRVYDQSQSAAATGTKSIVWNTSTGDLASILLQVTNESDVAPTFVNNENKQNLSSGSSLVINKPAGTTTDDLMVAVCLNGGGTATWTGPSGWTEIADLNGRPLSGVYYRKATSADSSVSSYTFTSNPNRTLAGSIITLRYADYDTIGTSTSGSDPLILPAVTASLSQTMLLAVAGRDAASISPSIPTSMTSVALQNDTTAPSYRVFTQLVPKGSTGTRSTTVGSSTNVNGLMLVLKPTRSL